MQLLSEAVFPILNAHAYTHMGACFPFCPWSSHHFNPLAYTATCEAAGLARSINTQPAVRWNSETNPTSQHNRGMY